VVKAHGAIVQVTTDPVDGDHDWNVSVGRIPGTNVENPTEFTKRVNATWVEGDDLGGRFSGVSLTSTTEYHLFAIQKLSDGTIDAGWDDNIDGTNVPAGWQIVKRLASMMTNGSSNFIEFNQIGHEFLLDVPIADWSSANPGVDAVLETIDYVPRSVHAGALMGFSLRDTAPGAIIYMLVTSVQMPATAPGSTQQTLAVEADSEINNVSMQVPVDSSGQIRYELSASNASTTVKGFTRGWYDPLLV